MTAQTDNVYFDNSMLEAFRACPRKFYFRHVRDWEFASPKVALSFGSAWHSSMDVIWKGATIKDKTVLYKDACAAFLNVWVETGMTLDDGTLMTLYPRTPGRAFEMLHHYLETYYDRIKDYEILGIEQPFVIPLTDGSDNIFYMGRLDKIWRDKGRVYIADHKTTGSDKSSWLESFTPNNQVDGYLCAGYMTYGDAFWGLIIDGALVQKGSKAIPPYPAGIAFPRIPVQRLFGHIESWRWETLYSINLVKENFRLLEESKISGCDFMMAFPKNTTACSHYGSCIYRYVCKMIVNPLRMEDAPEGFKVSKWSPMKGEENGASE